MEQRGKVIIVTGIIGAGKSSLSRELAQELGGLFLSEPDEKAAATGSNPYLSDFYADQSRWALTMQLHLLGIRYRMHQHAQWHAMSAGEHAVLDSSYWQDTAYARLQLVNGAMSQREYDTYTALYQAMTASVLLPNVCIRLKVSPEVAQRRVVSRMETQTGRTCENVIDLGYLRDLDTEVQRMVDALQTYGVDVIEVPWDEDRQTPEAREPIVTALAKAIRQVPENDDGYELRRLHGRRI